MKIAEQLSEIQVKLRAPKNQHNSFGNYDYRSCEDILTALKPLLKEQGVTLTLDDSVEPIGNRIYIKATAKLQNSDGEVIENHAFAREAESKKGMDDSQITGTASSYARKYALNGLFLIDDTKDPDSDQYNKQTGQKQQEPPTGPQGTACTANEINALHNEIVRAGGTEEAWLDFVGKHVKSGPKPKKLEDITKKEFVWSMEILGKRESKAAESK